MTAPVRKIVHSTQPRRHAERRGFVALSTLECGHQEWTRSSERRTGKCHCFDCYYHKPVPEMGLIVLDELNCTPVE